MIYRFVFIKESKQKNSMKRNVDKANIINSNANKNERTLIMKVTLGRRRAAMRQQRRIEQRKRQLLWALSISLLLVTIAVSYWLIHTMRTGTDSSTSSPDNQVSLSTSSQETTTASQSSKITLTASGDMLYHRPVLYECI